MTVVDMRGTHARCVQLSFGRASVALRSESYLTRVVTNLERLSEAPTAADAAVAENLIDATPMPELQHNLRLIVDLAEAEIQVCNAFSGCDSCPFSAELPALQTLDRKLRQEKDTHTILIRETARLRTEVESHAKRVAKAQEARAMA